MDNLFSVAQSKNVVKPLADLLRPTSLDDIVGQDHILGEGQMLRRKIESNQLGSVILWGSTGVGKTTIAKVVGKVMNKKFVELHPALHNMADIKKVADAARMENTLVFIDEIHRYSVSVTDVLLNYTEEGLFDLIAATSLNPAHSLSVALTSRTSLLKLNTLTDNDIEKVITRALWHLNEEGINVKFNGQSLSMLAIGSNGDARKALGSLADLVVGLVGAVEITEDMIRTIYEYSPLPYDKNGDAHYDVTSALAKSMRGSDEDATLYWLARQIESGEDPRFIARRLMIHASEDVGLADPSALQTATSAYLAAEKIGYPECSIILANAALHICRAPKSNSSYMGIKKALEYVRTQPFIQVPNHLKDSHYKAAKSMGVEGYKNPHNYPEGWIDQEYLPNIPKGTFYQSEAKSPNNYEGRADKYWESITGIPPVTKFD